MHNIKLASERAVLGTTVLNPEAIDAFDIQPDDFKDDRHRWICRTMRTRLRAGLPVDTIGLVECVVDMTERERDRHGGVEYVAALGDAWLPVVGLPGRLGELRAATRRRRLHGELAESAESLHDPSTGIESVASGVIEAAGAALACESGPVEPARVVVGRVADRLTAQAGGKRPRYVRSGVPEWDVDLDYGGICAEGVTLIIGASGMGKTSLLNRLAVGLASTGCGVYLHGTETSRDRRIEDMALSLAGVDGREWARRSAAEPDGPWVRDAHRALHDAQARLYDLPIEVSGAGLDVDRVCAIARSLYGQRRCRAVIVDYLQDLPHLAREGLRRGDRVAQVGYASGQLKNLSADLGISVIVGAQVSGEKAGPGIDPRPQLWDVQWSSSAHQDAEEVYALYRDDYYRDRFKDKWQSKGAAGVLDVYARKRRQGRLGMLSLPFDGPTKWIGARPKAPADPPYWDR